VRLTGAPEERDRLLNADGCGGSSASGDRPRRPPSQAGPPYIIEDSLGSLGSFRES
jgi:hypothetical protein